MLEWRLKIVMAERDVSATELAQRTGLAKGTVSKLRKSKAPDRIHAETLITLCKALGCQPGDLMRYRGI
jgi:putative transcriptional regulator